MIKSVNIRLNEWADWSMRCGVRLGFPSRSVIGRVMDEGANAGVRGTPRAPIIDMPDAIEETDTAVKSLPPHLWELVQERYLRAGTDQQAAVRLRISYRAFRTRLDQAHHWLAGKLGAEAA